MLEAAAVSNVGTVRTNHEDNYLLGRNQWIEPDTQKEMVNSLFTCYHRFEGEHGIFVVSDGMGGNSSGETASLRIVTWLNERYRQLLNSGQDAVRTALSELNQYIYGYSVQNHGCRGMAATLSGIIVGYDGVFCINAGDSRTYMLEHGKMQQITADHSEGQRLLRMNLLDKKELENFPSRKKIYKYIGMSGECVADVQKICISGERLFIICSDGLNDVLEDEKICTLADCRYPVLQIGQNLMKAALESKNGCADNVTILLVNML